MWLPCLLVCLFAFVCEGSDVCLGVCVFVLVVLLFCCVVGVLRCCV